jgi:hypothetical protein
MLPFIIKANGHSDDTDVDATEVDDAGLDEAAQFEQMMPVPADAGETGGIEAKHGANLAGA